MSTYTGVTNFKKQSGFFRPPCISTTSGIFTQAIPIKNCYLLLSWIHSNGTHILLSYLLTYTV